MEWPADLRSRIYQLVITDRVAAIESITRFPEGHILKEIGVNLLSIHSGECDKNSFVAVADQSEEGANSTGGKTPCAGSLDLVHWFVFSHHRDGDAKGTGLAEQGKRSNQSFANYAARLLDFWRRIC